MNPVKIGFYRIIHYSSHLIYSVQFSVKSIPGVSNLIYDNFRVSMQFFFYRFQFCIEYLHLHTYLSHFPYFIYYINALILQSLYENPTSGLCVSPFVFLLIMSQIFLPLCKFNIFLDTQFSRSVMSNSLLPHELQHARPPCPSPTPGVHSDSRLASQ